MLLENSVGSLARTIHFQYVQKKARRPKLKDQGSRVYTLKLELKNERYHRFKYGEFQKEEIKGQIKPFTETEG